MLDSIIQLTRFDPVRTTVRESILRRWAQTPSLQGQCLADQIYKTDLSVLISWSGEGRATPATLSKQGPWKISSPSVYYTSKQIPSISNENAVFFLEPMENGLAEGLAHQGSEGLVLAR